MRFDVSMSFKHREEKLKEIGTWTEADRLNKYKLMKFVVSERVNRLKRCLTGD